MWTMIESLQPLVALLQPAFSQPSCVSSWRFLLAWIMCLGKHTLRRVGENLNPQTPPDHSQRHGLDSYYNFFARSAWTPQGLAHRIGVLIFTHLPFLDGISLLVDDTLIHKRGKNVWGLGWFRDAVASTKKRVATASGHNWVVLAVAVHLPWDNTPILALPLLARLHLPGKGKPSCADLARQMLAEVLSWWPKRRFTLVGDGAYATATLLKELDERLTFVGRLRGDAAVYDPRVPSTPKSRRGAKAKKGMRLPTPKEAAAKADRKRTAVGSWVWQEVCVSAYGRRRMLRALSYQVVWPRVLGYRVIQVVVVRDPWARMQDAYLFTTDLTAELSWVIEQFAWRWSIEVLFRGSKQVLDIESAQQWSKSSVEKVAPWVWSMQSVVMVWYVTAGRLSAEAAELRPRLGPWDSEWSLRHMLQVLRRAILDATINPNFANVDELREMIKTLKNWANLAA